MKHMKDIETFTELAKTPLGRDPLVEDYISQIIETADPEVKTIAQSLEKLRSHMGPIAENASIDEIKVFAVIAAQEAGWKRADWSLLEARINVYRKHIKTTGTSTGGASDGEPDPSQSQVLQKKKRQDEEER